MTLRRLCLLYSSTNTYCLVWGAAVAVGSAMMTKSNLQGRQGSGQERVDIVDELKLFKWCREVWGVTHEAI
jgi:hypothetical protein